LTLGEAVVFAGLLSAINYLWYPTSLLSMLSYGIYSLVGAFVIAFEIPGFLLLSRFDGRIVDSLEKTRDDLLAISYSFDTKLSQLRDGWSRRRDALSSTHLYPLVESFISTCERIKNLDKTFWQLVLSEVTLSIKSFSERSKHPAPKLIDILSLSGLSFIIAQLLKILG
jgi:hypothetical protein